MAGKKELGFSKPTVSSLRELAARTTLRRVRMQGHPYVEVREGGKRTKRLYFFCTLCLAPCYGDTVLFDHLRGKLHNRRYAAAKVTLMGPNPWPFDDGVLFFNNSCEDDKPIRLLEGSNKDKSVATVNCNRNEESYRDELSESSESACDKHLDSVQVYLGSGTSTCDVNVTADREDCDVLVPGVLLKDEICDLELKFIGFAQMGVRFRERNGVSEEISKIWCEWLGYRSSADEDLFMIPEHDFAVVIFKYVLELGTKSSIEDVKALLPPGANAEIESPRKRMKSLSDPEDISEFFIKQDDSSDNVSPSAHLSPKRLKLDLDDNQLMRRKFVSRKTLRKELRRQQHIAAGRMCDICQQMMLPGKDVAALLNIRTGRLACSSRNLNGAFHVYHTSCLIHWILLCEYEIFSNLSVSPEVKQSCAAKCGAKRKEIEKDNGAKATKVQVCSVFCPECQGTGVTITEGDDLQIPVVTLSEMFNFKINVSTAHKAWLKCPEALQNCSIGFSFPSQSDETVQENVSRLKLVHFYTTDM